jgi:hypothetical protein
MAASVRSSASMSLRHSLRSPVNRPSVVAVDPEENEQTVIFSLAWPGTRQISEVHAFPAEMAERVKIAVRPLARGQIHATSDEVIPVYVAEDLLKIPYRLYYAKRQLLKAIDRPGEAGLIALCLGTRHHDGFIREQCVRRLLTSSENWTAPFIVQLLGEYVIEVVQPIHERFLELVDTKYVDFFRHNAQYCQYLECRAISYWNEYYRRRFQRHKQYPAIEALAALAAAAKPMGKWTPDSNDGCVGTYGQTASN